MGPASASVPGLASLREGLCLVYTSLSSFTLLLVMEFTIATGSSRTISKCLSIILLTQFLLK